MNSILQREAEAYRMAEEAAQVTRELQEEEARCDAMLAEQQSK